MAICIDCYIGLHPSERKDMRCQACKEQQKLQTYIKEETPSEGLEVQK